MSASVGMILFALAHQVLVAPAPGVFVGVPVAVVLSVPVIAAYAALSRAVVEPSGVMFGLVIFSGLVPHYGLVTIAMWDRTFDEGPRGSWQLAAIWPAPLLAGAICWVWSRSPIATALIGVGMLILTFSISGFQQSEPDWRNVGAFISLLPACLGAGWVLGRTSPRPGISLTSGRRVAPHS